MMYNVNLSVFLIVAVGSTAAFNKGRIIGGQEVNIEDYPFVVAVQYRGRQTCGGSILTPNKILTAAHCSDGKDFTKFSVRAGSSSRSSGGVVVNVHTILNHRDFDSSTLFYDISVHVLRSSLPMQNGIQPITLIGTGVHVAAGARAYILGWGYTSAQNDTTDRLKMLTTPKRNERICGNWYFTYNSTIEMCFGGEFGQSACRGDSGGPVLIEDNGAKLLVGVFIGRSGPCEEDTNPIVSSKVSFFRGFIDEIVNNVIIDVRN